MYGADVSKRIDELITKIYNIVVTHPPMLREIFTEFRLNNYTAQLNSNNIEATITVKNQKGDTVLHIILGSYLLSISPNTVLLDDKSMREAAEMMRKIAETIRRRTRLADKILRNLRNLRTAAMLIE